MKKMKYKCEIQVMNQSNSISDSSGFLSTIKIRFIDHTTKKMLSTCRKMDVTEVEISKPLITCGCLVEGERKPLTNQSPNLRNQNLQHSMKNKENWD